MEKTPLLGLDRPAEETILDTRVKRRQSWKWVVYELRAAKGRPEVETQVVGQCTQVSEHISQAGLFTQRLMIAVCFEQVF
jgi:hypothetical protein